MYLRMPPPWNAVPTYSPQDVNSFTSLLSSGVTGKFSGKLEDFPRWRMNFILLFHSKDLLLSLKFMALTNSLEGDAERHKRGALPNVNGYQLVIYRLEEEYGHYARHMDSYAHLGPALAYPYELLRQNA